MINEVVHEILINCTPEEAFSVCSNVEDWPEIFPPCHATRVIEKSDSHIIFEITADTEPGKSDSWVSRREIDHKNMKLSFKQTKVAKPLHSMEGEWRIEKIQDQTKISLAHTYDVDEKDYAFVKNILDKNSNSELKAIKEYLEK